MATVKQYALQLWGAHKVVSAKLGLNVEWGSADVRTSVIATDVMLGTVLKVLVDKGLVTNADLTAAFNAVAGAAFPSLPSVVPNSSDGQPIPDPDLGA